MLKFVAHSVAESRYTVKLLLLLRIMFQRGDTIFNLLRTMLQRLNEVYYSKCFSSDGLLLATPAYRSGVTLGDRSFQVAAPALWNVLPREIRSITDLGVFKRHLKMHLFREAFY